MRGVVASHLRRAPTRAEINAGRRAAHDLAAAGQATILRIKPTGAGHRSAYLILARPGTAIRGKLLDQLAADAAAATSTDRFEPTVMAQDLASSVDLLSAAVQAIPPNHIDPAAAARLVASINASLERLRRIRRHLKVK